jgi:hypothetical protein
MVYMGSDVQASYGFTKVDSARSVVILTEYCIPSNLQTMNLVRKILVLQAI